jgi:hypothetical protein
MQMQKKGQGRSYWEPLLQELAAEGKSLSEFARQRGLSIHSLSWWRRKLAMVKSVPPAGASKFVALQVKAGEAMPLSASSAAQVIVRVSAAVSVECKQLPSVAWLVALSEALKGVR